MNPTFRPMLAAPVTTEEFKRLRFPVLATPKFDGIRIVTADLPDGDNMCVPLCRSLKAVPNNYIRQHLSKYCYPGFDGEIMTYTYGKMDPFNVVQSKVMSQLGHSNFVYHIFDCDIMADKPFAYFERLKLLGNITLPTFCEKVLPSRCETLDQLQEFGELAIAAGFEGMCFRTPESRYKYGRSTLKQQWLVKYKEFVDSEAIIVGVEQFFTNQNVAKLNELGYLSRSTHAAGMVAKNMLGALICEPLAGGNRFKIGTGFTETQRENLWFTRSTLGGKIVKFKHQPFGAKDNPRLPVFISIRDLRDMDITQSQKEFRLE